MGGRAKALLPHPDGSARTLVRAAAETLAEAGLHPIVAVLGCRKREIARELAGVPGVRTVVNPAWREGMLGSLRCGAREAARASATAQWFLTAPVDQPFLSADLVRRVLAARAEGVAAVVPATPEMERRGVWGHPVALARRLLPEMMELRGGTEDRGAAALIRRHWSRVSVVAAEPRDLLDVDRWEEYLRLRDSPR